MGKRCVFVRVREGRIEQKLKARSAQTHGSSKPHSWVLEQRVDFTAVGKATQEEARLRE